MYQDLVYLTELENLPNIYMKILHAVKRTVLICSLLVSGSTLQAQPTKTDYIRTISELGLFLSMEYGWKEKIIPHSPRFTKPNGFDQYFRNNLRWDLKDIEKAAEKSDLLLFGVFLGTLPLMPLLSDEDYTSLLLINMEIFAINGLITHLVKSAVGRQRPSSYYETWENEEEGNLSYFSGHTSYAFAIGTSTAMMLSRAYPDNKSIIWGTTMSLAAATGYFRIAADKHYMTDVISGAVIGSLIAYYIQEQNTSKYFPSISSNGNQQTILYRFEWRI